MLTHGGSERTLGVDRGADYSGYRNCVEGLRERAGTRYMRAMAGFQLDRFYAEAFAGHAAAPFRLNGAIGGAHDGRAWHRRPSVERKISSIAWRAIINRRVV